VHDGKVGVLGVVLAAGRLGPREVGRLAEVIVLQLLLERLVGSFREHGLLLQNGEDAQRLQERYEYCLLLFVHLKKLHLN
jgi:hypothetical protein